MIKDPNIRVGYGVVGRRGNFDPLIPDDVFWYADAVHGSAFGVQLESWWQS